MTKQSLVKLLAVTALVLGAAWWASSSRDLDRNEHATGKPLVDGLKAGVNNVTALRIVEAGDKPVVTLVKGDTTWTVGERDHYPADLTKVREYLLKIADATLLEAKTGKKENHAKLGVEDVAAADAKGLRVEIDGLKAPVKIVVGNANSLGQSGTFVRHNDEAQSWLSKGSLIPDRLTGNWLDKNLLDIASSRIERFEITKAGKTLSGTKANSADEKYTIENIPKGRELANEFEGNTIASLLASLTLEDVRKSAPDAASMIEARYIGFDGLIVTAHATMEGDKGYARFVASIDEPKAVAHILAAQAVVTGEYTKAKADYDAALAAFTAANTEAADKTKPATEAPIEPVAPPSVVDAAKDQAERLAALKQEVENINARCAGWDFLLPAYKFGSINKSLEDLLKAPT